MYACAPPPHNVGHEAPGVTDGTRTRDSQYHKLELYQLSYGHHEGCPVCQMQRKVPPLFRAAVVAYHVSCSSRPVLRCPVGEVRMSGARLRPCSRLNGSRATLGRT